ncbi:hypothetical protein VMUT_2002 [Vulcanisaeta moutnovskia 768-28]|uniref:TPR repeat-containing protein n=1 Tax=Vulcanisaeta moutnovskia (strain 768-28) TaxID=985053 RepID=F0QWA6_VULM7|nr:hypothetical protein VMUT_2002 [Vulcanisaeta moutnovskia 768-28]
MLEVVGVIDVNELTSMLNIPEDPRLLLGDLIEVNNNEAKLSQKGREVVSSIANCEEVVFRILYEYYRSRPRSLERDVALAEYGSKYVELSDYPIEITNEVLTTCLRLARFGAEANLPELARRYGVKAFLIGMRIGDYAAALEGLGHAVRKSRNPLELMPFIDQAIKLDKETINKHLVNYVGLMLSVGEGLIGSGFPKEALRFINHGLELIGEPNSELTCYLWTRLTTNLASAYMELMKYAEAIEMVNTALGKLTNCRIDERTRRQLVLELRDRLGVIKYLSGDLSGAYSVFSDVLREALELNEIPFAASAMHNLVKAKVLMSSDCSNYPELLRPIHGWTLRDSLNHYLTTNDQKNLRKVRILLTVLLIGIGDYDEAVKLLGQGDNDDIERFLRELITILKGEASTMTTEYRSPALADLATYINTALRITKWQSTGNKLWDQTAQALKNEITQIMKCQIPKLVLLQA